jgi:hypothetical protein
LLFAFLTVLAKCEKNGSLDRTEAFPGSGFGYFEIKESRFQSQQVLLLTEFSRFMNKQALKMLKVQSNSTSINFINVFYYVD